MEKKGFLWLIFELVFDFCFSFEIGMMSAVVSLAMLS